MSKNARTYNDDENITGFNDIGPSLVLPSKNLIE
jgi:hypothetical protein